MNKILAISFILLHLFGNTEMVQVFKIPNLIHHYQEHHRHNKSISFLSFLSMHYGGDDGVSSDDERDMQLPFKQLQAHNFIPAAVVIETPQLISPFSLAVADSYIQTGPSFILSGHSSNFLRPPICCHI